MVRQTTLNSLADLEREMARTGRSAEGEAIREAREALTPPQRVFLSTAQAAERLGVSVSTVKRWIQRGVLVGGASGNRWRVSSESVERVLRLRETLRELDREGNPSAEEIRALSRRPRHASRASDG